MDEIDVRLITALVRDPLAQIGDLTGPTGLTRNAVKARYDRLRAARVLDEPSLVPNPALWGWRPVLFVYPNPPVVPGGYEAALAIDPVIGYSTTHEDLVAITIYSGDADPTPPPGLDACFGAPPDRVYVQADRPTDPHPPVLSRIQWRVLAAMIAEPQIRIGALAEATGLTRATVQKARRMLLDGGFIRVETAVLPEHGSGVVLYHMYAHGPACLGDSAVPPAAGCISIEDRTVTPPGLYMFCRAPSVGKAVAALGRVRALEGVDHAELILHKDGGVAKARLIRWCEEALADWEAVGRRAVERARATDPTT